MSAFRRAVAALFALVIAGTSLSAHRRDEFLQAARLGVDERRVAIEVSLTPGIAVADAIITRIDRNADGVFSEAERRAYVEEALSAMTVGVDGRSLSMKHLTSTFPPPAALRSGDAAIDMSAIATLPPLSSGTHRVTFTNAYRPDISVYLVNALAPGDGRIAIVSQRRDPDQRATTIRYTLASASSAMLPLWVIAPGAVAWLVVRRRVLPYGTQRS